MRWSALPSLSRRCYLRKPKTLPELRTPTHPNTASIRSSALLVGASTTKLINSVTTGTHTVASKNARQANITPRAQHFGLGYFKRLPPPLWPRAGTRTPELTRLRPHKARAPTTHRGGSNGGYRGHSDYGKQQPAPASIQAFCLNCLHQHGGTRISPAYTASRLPLKRATAELLTPAWGHPDLSPAYTASRLPLKRATAELLTPAWGHPDLASLYCWQASAKTSYGPSTNSGGITNACQPGTFRTDRNKRPDRTVSFVRPRPDFPRNLWIRVRVRITLTLSIVLETLVSQAHPARHAYVTATPSVQQLLGDGGNLARSSTKPRR